MTHLRKSDWLVANIKAHGEAVALIETWHYSQGAPNTSVYRHGLFAAGLFQPCVGVAMWLPPTKAAGVAVAGDAWQGVLTLTRLVVAPDMPTNSASFLLGRSMRMIDRGRWPVLLTYADTSQGHTGAIYKATNWTCDGPVAAGDTWTMPDGTQRGRKRGGRSLTVAEMKALGATRNPAMPKIRYRHDVRAGLPFWTERRAS